MRDVVSTTFENHILPRDSCSSTHHLDYMWCSKTVSVLQPVTDVNRLIEECTNSWSPGLVVYFCPGALTETTLIELLDQLEETVAKLGRARRICIGDSLATESISQRLYKCFYCVENVNSQGLTHIVDTE
jgi:hypothetical protein